MRHNDAPSANPIKKDRWFYRHRYAFSIFFFILLYNSLVVKRLNLWKVTEITYAYHAVDFSIGFNSQILPGAIYNLLLGDNRSMLSASIYETVLLLLFFAGVAFMLERFILSIAPDGRPDVLKLMFFYLTGAYTFAIFTYELGMLDVYWLFFSIFALLFIKKKVVRAIVPVFFVLSLLVHFSSAVSYLVFFGILILYNASIAKNKKEKIVYFLILTVSALLSVGLLLFLLKNQGTGMNYDITAFRYFMKDRGSDYLLYYNYAFYNKYVDTDVVSPETYAIASPVARILAVIGERIAFNFKLTSTGLKKQIHNLVATLIILAPIVAFIYKVLFRFFKAQKENKLKKVTLLLMMVQFPFTLTALLYSLDIVRWFTHGFLIFFTLFIYLMYHEEKLRDLFFEEAGRYRDVRIQLLYALSYACYTLRVYG